MLVSLKTTLATTEPRRTAESRAKPPPAALCFLEVYLLPRAPTVEKRKEAGELKSSSAGRSSGPAGGFGVSGDAGASHSCFRRRCPPRGKQEPKGTDRERPPFTRSKSSVLKPRILQSRTFFLPPPAPPKRIPRKCLRHSFRRKQQIVPANIYIKRPVRDTL